MSNPNGHVIHGLYHTDLHGVWASMKQRCDNPKCRGFRWYGAKGVRVCKDWQDFKPFYEWAMSHGYRKGLTLDRQNVFRDYSPENCRWVDWETQQNNKTSNNILTLDGVSHTLTEWSKLTCIPRTTIHGRLRLGWSVEDALTKRPRQYSGV